MIQKEFQAVLGLFLSCSTRSLSIPPSARVSMIAKAVSSSDVMSIKDLCDFDCNILHKDLIKDKERMTSFARSKGVKYFIVPGSDLEASKEILDLVDTEKDVGFFATAGVHPYNVKLDQYCETTFSQLTSMVKNKHCFAVGECGLDYSEGFPEKAIQIEWFRAQVELAVLLSKPLYLHSRLATEDFLNILAEYGFGDGLKPPVPCCVHCFTGETDELETYLKWGFYIGLTGYIMKMDTEKLIIWLKLITLEKLVIETDAPYMGFKGCRDTEVKDRKRVYPNIPASLISVFDRICEVSGWSKVEVAQQTTNNALHKVLLIPETHESILRNLDTLLSSSTGH